MAPSPAPPTPLDPPRLYISVFDRLAPRVVFTQEFADTMAAPHWVWLPLTGTAVRATELTE